VLILVPDDVRVLTILGNLLVNRNAIGEALSTFH
jgi:hypothetical protein